MKTTIKKRRQSKPRIEDLTQYQLRRIRDQKFIEDQLLKKIALETGIPLKVLQEYRNQVEN